LGLTYQDESFITDFDIGTTDPHPTLPSYTRFDAAAYYNVSEDRRIVLDFLGNPVNTARKSKTP